MTPEELNDDQASGIRDDWYDDEADDDDDFQIKAYDITASPNDFNISTMFSFIESGAVIIPVFQRNYVWDQKRASKLIESIIIGLPIPQIFLYEEARNKFLVIDGQQRLMSIYYFMKERFPRKDKRIELRRIFDEHGKVPIEVLDNDDYFSPFKLKLTERLPMHPNQLNKCDYSSLGDMKTTFELRTVRNIIIKQNAPDAETDEASSIYEIFNRLNSGGINLKPQEIRSSLYHSEFYALLYEINLDPRWRSLLGVPEPDLHMKDIEILLRAFAMVMSGHEYKPSMTRFLNFISKRAKSLSTAKVQYLKQLFEAFLGACSSLSPTAFVSSQSKKVNISLIEAVFAAECESSFNSNSLDVPELAPSKLQALKDDHEFVKASQAQTASTANVNKRVERARAILLG